MGPFFYFVFCPLVIRFRFVRVFRARLVIGFVRTVLFFYFCAVALGVVTRGGSGGRFSRPPVLFFDVAVTAVFWFPGVARGTVWEGAYCYYLI